MSIQPTPSAYDNGPPAAQPEEKVTQLLKRYDHAKKTWDNWKHVWEECYTYALPYRQQFDETVPGERNTLEIFDETAVVTLPEMASKIGSALIPSYQRWATLLPGPEILPADKDAVARALEEIGVKIFHAIDNSNFYAEAHEAIIECGIGTGVLEIWPGTAANPIRATAVPLTDIVLENGPFGTLDAGFRRRRMKPQEAMVEWPDAAWPKEFEICLRDRPNDALEFLCATYRDWTFPQEVITRHCVIWKEKKVIVQERVWIGLGSSPMIPFRWSKASGEVYGRGPLLNALSAIKTCNLVVQLLLDNAELQIAGLWQLESNGNINPENISLIPGTIVPKMPGTTGLEPVVPPGRFDLGQFILEDMRANIKKALYSDQFAPMNQTPMSATEVALRQQDLAERIGASFGRLQAEFVVPCIQRVAWILKEAGQIQMPAPNGRAVKIQPVSPLARSQRNVDIQAIDRMMQQLVAYYGPEVVMLVTKPADMAQELSELHGVKKSVLNTPEQVKALLAQAAEAAKAQQAAAAASAQGGGPVQ
jgi:hypothetical protein